MDQGENGIRSLERLALKGGLPEKSRLAAAYARAGEQFLCRERTKATKDFYEDLRGTERKALMDVLNNLQAWYPKRSIWAVGLCVITRKYESIGIASAGKKVAEVLVREYDLGDDLQLRIPYAGDHFDGEFNGESLPKSSLPGVVKQLVPWAQQQPFSVTDVVMDDTEECFRVDIEHKKTATPFKIYFEPCEYSFSTQDNYLLLYQPRQETEEPAKQE